MGYPGIKAFDRTFVERTKEILKSYTGERDFTLLINTMIGLLILPNEHYEKNKKPFFNCLLNKKITDCDRIKSIFTERIIKIEDENGREKDIQKCIFKKNSGDTKKASELPLYELLKKMRNAFAHFNVVPIKDGNRWDGIIIKNVNKNKITTMELYISQEELYIFVDYVIGKYLDTYK
jgi:hypothetical protein